LKGKQPARVLIGLLLKDILDMLDEDKTE